MRFILALSSLFVLSMALQAQTENKYERSGLGRNEMRDLESADQFSLGFQSGDTKVRGFRVQLVAESGQGSQDRAQTVKNAYTKKYNNNPKVYLLWDPPNFKVRVGDFSTKFEAALFWKNIQTDFPNSYVVEDDINLIDKK